MHRRPDQRVAEQGQQDKGAYAQIAVAFDRHPRPIIHPVVGIVDFAILPAVLTGGSKALQNIKTQQGACAERRVLVFHVGQRQAIVAVRPFEPDDFCAQAVTTGRDLDFDALVGVKPNPNRGGVLCGRGQCLQQQGGQDPAESPNRHADMAKNEDRNFGRPNAAFAAF